MHLQDMIGIVSSVFFEHCEITMMTLQPPSPSQKNQAP